MLRRQLGTLLLVTCLILTTVPAALGAQNTITVNPTSGSGAQTAINNAINSAASGATASNPGVVVLTAGTYEISAPIILKSNVVLKGSGDDTIIFAKGSVCNSASSPAYIYGSGVSNVEVSHLQFKSSATSPSDGGHGDYRNCIKFASVTNSKVHDILFTRYLYSDGVRISKSSGIEVYNCRMKSVGHDGVSFLSGTKDSRMYNCYVEVQTNTGVRVDNCANIEVDHNTFTGSAGSGWCCVELENTLTNVDVHHNIMHDYKGSSSSAGIGNWNAKGSISVRDNVMWNVSPYVEVGSGSNTLGPSDHSVENWVAKGYGYGSLGSASVAQETTTVDPISGTDTQTAVNETPVAETEEDEVATTNNQTTVNETAVTSTVNETAVTETVPEQVVGTDNILLTEENTTDIVIDNRLREVSPDTVYQEKAYIDIGGRPGIGKYRDLLLFNLSEYSDAENISSATLSLYWYYPDGRERPEDAVIEIYRPAAAWNPENVTWNSRDDGVLWTQPGGDWFDMNNASQGDAPYATITLKGSDIPDNRYYELNVTDLVKEYVSGEYENTGFLIKTRTENADYVAFYSSEVEDENQRPMLNIEEKAVA
ncbi:DNRLRE domain-containing protein [Methanosarcina sp. DH2]|uniref:disaggregatase related repeat-containing protein n=1 Tax=Methanosarcina sp. DH2 TaxID=2605639 RepID=UPI001E547D39|nr:disaggregatase related repeat-containing protein [Methanosarcina sp. DH2]MCC4768774.1 DNRLRE domain-containing protein [Methanosarcina sp. DH2]